MIENTIITEDVTLTTLKPKTTKDKFPSPARMQEQEILVVNDTRDFGFSYYFPFRPYGKYRGIDISDNPKFVSLNNVRLVVFTGGPDVNPVLYNEPRHPRTYCAERRDWYEIQIFEKAQEKKIPCFGICRGAQLLCVLSGGKMDQHVQNHSWSHDIITDDGRIFRANSSHHQVMLPNSNTGKIVAWAEEPNDKVEAEAVEYPLLNAAGVQYHPEAMNEQEEALLYARELVEKLLGIGV